MEAKTTDGGLIMKSDEECRLDVITETTKVPLGIVVGCVSVFVVGALWINNSLNRIEQRLTIIEMGTTDRFRATDMKVWILQFRLDNPALKVPPVFPYIER